MRLVTDLVLSVVIPSYNEEARIDATVREVSDYLQTRQLAGEILLADDGSTDRTIELARAAVTESVPLRVLATSSSVMTLSPWLRAYSSMRFITTPRTKDGTRFMRLWASGVQRSSSFAAAPYAICVRNSTIGVAPSGSYAQESSGPRVSPVSA